MTTCSLPTVPPVASPWWQRSLEVLTERLAGLRSSPLPTERDYESLAGLSAATLRDIGAPEWLRERAEMSRQLPNRTLPW